MHLSPCERIYGKGKIQFDGLKRHRKTLKHAATLANDKEKRELTEALTFLEEKKVLKSIPQQPDLFGNKPKSQA